MVLGIGFEFSAKCIKVWSASSEVFERLFPAGWKTVLVWIKVILQCILLLSLRVTNRLKM